MFDLSVVTYMRQRRKIQCSSPAQTTPCRWNIAMCVAGGKSATNDDATMITFRSWPGFRDYKSMNSKQQGSARSQR